MGKVFPEEVIARLGFEGWEELSGRKDENRATCFSNLICIQITGVTDPDLVPGSRYVILHFLTSFK